MEDTEIVVVTQQATVGNDHIAAVYLIESDQTELDKSFDVIGLSEMQAIASQQRAVILGQSQSPLERADSKWYREFRFPAEGLKIDRAKHYLVLGYEKGPYGLYSLSSVLEWHPRQDGW